MTIRLKENPMTGNLFIDSVQIGQVDFTIIDESMGVIGGQLNCYSTYENFRGDIQRLSENKGIANSEDFLFSVWVDDKFKLTPEGGIGVTDLVGFDEIYVEVGGLNEQQLKQFK
jgi:hypothetical protein